MAARRGTCENRKELLRLLAVLKPRTRKTVLKDADRSLIYSICELCDNTLAGNVPLSPSDKKKLSKYKALLRRLAKRGESWQKKKQILVQRGGGFFIPLLLSVVAPLLSNLIFGKK